MERYEVVVNVKDDKAIAAVRKVIRKINGDRYVPEYYNAIHVRFEYWGTMLDGVECMAAGASGVSKI